MAENRTADGRVGRKIQNKGLRAKLQEYFSKRPGQTIYISDLMTDVGASSEEAMRESVNSLRTSVQGWTDTLQVEINGRAWVYKPPAGKSVSAKRVFEELAVTKAGDIIIQDEQGRIYKAQEL